MTQYNLIYNWYALYTRPRWEKKVYNELNNCGFEAYLPLIKKVKQWSDRTKKVEEPLIRSYVFVKTSEKEYYDILNVDGAIRYIFFEGKAAPIPEWQIDALRKTLENQLSFKLTNEKLKPGEKVKIKEGPLKGTKGEIIQIKGKNNLVIRIENIGYNLLIEIEAENLG
ncbi:MAG: UpxY family transcription antiterminator [Bacteroidales bacterium]|nr:UpxY family transcription antiterminator [Bacteroidales bacterium]